MTRSRVVHSFWSWLAAIAVFALLVMPMSAGMAPPSNGFLVVPICTDHGLQQATLGPDGAPVPQPASGHNRICWFCLAHPGWISASPPELSLPRFVWLPLVSERYSGNHLLQPFFPPGHPTRAPPIDLG